jgi:hypothetical protein
MPQEASFAAATSSPAFGAADSAMVPEKYFARKRYCFQLKASFHVFRFSPVFAAREDGKRKATSDCGASPAAIVVHSLIKQAGSFIPLHV